MKNILFISQYLNIAGTESFMMNVIRKINTTLFHIDFLIFSNNVTEYSVEAEKLGACIHRLPPRKSGLKYYKELNSFFKNNAEKYDAIHFCGGNVSSIAPIYYAYKYKIPIRIVHSHSSCSVGIANRLLHYLNKNFLFKLCTHFYACSSEAAKHFFGKRNSTIINNGIDTELYKFSQGKRNFVRKKYDIADSTHVIGHIGRFDYVKNHKFLVEIFSKYKERFPDSKLLLVGIGSLEEEVKQKVKQIGLTDSVIFLGKRSDIPDILCAMDCFVMPSIFEGLPFVLIEAQSTGLPCVISDTINNDAKLSPYLEFISLNDNTDKWVDAINKHISSENDRNLGVKYVSENGFDIKSTVKYLERIYNGTEN